MQPIKIQKKYFQILWFFVVRWLNNLLVFLSLRKSRKFWGMVYDSVSKQPLDPVIVKLVYAQSGEAVKTCVTDLAGRYGFLAEPGKFKIFAKKSNYSFPSQRIKGDNDGIFTDVYKGEFFELYDELEVVGPNIPMDALRPDWNQKAKLKVLNTFPFFKLLFRKLIFVFFWFGFIWALVFVLNDFFISYKFTFSGWPQYALGVYVAVLILNSIVPEYRLWGRVLDKKNKLPFAGAALELTNPALAGVVLAKCESQADGRFLLRANPGKYLLKVVTPYGSGQTSVKVTSHGVVNLDLLLVDK